MPDVPAIPPETYLDKVLAVDPLKDAADVAGDHDLVTPFGQHLSWRYFEENRDDRRRALLDADDTTHQDELPRFLSIAERLGFSIVHDETFTNHRHDSSAWYGVLFQPDTGAVLEVDTFGDDLVNSATLSFNWKPRIGLDGNFVEGSWRAVSTGRFASASPDDPRSEWVFAGSHDAVEALARKVEKLELFGSFVTPWRFDARLDLTHYGDFAEQLPLQSATVADHQARSRIRKEQAAYRAALLPPDVRSRILVHGVDPER